MRRKNLLALLLILGVASFVSACVHERILAPQDSLSLATFTANEVDVRISLERNGTGTVFLAATFIPPAGYHLYGKDLPRDGVDGLGRPTLLELTANSKLTAQGEPIESVAAILETFGKISLPVYPAGPVTLRMAVALPAGGDWIDDEIRLTYMACSPTGCKPPVIGKIVNITVPSAENIFNP
jgi:hypothetical protein